MAESPASDGAKKPALREGLGLWSLIALGVGGIIGSGVFGLPAVMGSVAGPAFVLAIVLVGLITVVLALIYAEIGSAFPLTGGPYSIPRLALGDSAGFLVGWGYFLYAFIGTAAIIDILITYAGFYVPGLASSGVLTPTGIALAVIALWVFTLINVLGVRWGGLFGMVTTVLKLVPLILFALVGLIFLSGANFGSFMTFGWTGVGLAMAFGFFSFTGFEAVVIPTGEVKNASKNIPRAMIVTISIVVILYVLIGLAFTGLINWSGLGLSSGDWASIGGLSSPLSDVSKAAGYGLLAAIVTAGAVASTAGAGGDWVLFQGRVPYAMAEDGLFPKAMGKVSPKYGTPLTALVFASLLTMVTQILIPSFPDVALLASITTLIPYAAAAVSLPILRSTKPTVPRPFKLPFGTALAGLGFVFASILVYWASWPWTVVGAALTLVGFPLYLLAKGKKVEFGRQAWFWAYVVGLAVISYLGDTNFIYENFLPISPLGLLVIPYDVIVVTVFSLLIFAWAYASNTRQKSALQRK